MYCQDGRVQLLTAATPFVFRRSTMQLEKLTSGFSWRCTIVMTSIADRLAIARRVGRFVSFAVISLFDLSCLGKVHRCYAVYPHRAMSVSLVYAHYLATQFEVATVLSKSSV